MMEEADQLCERLAIIDQDQIVAEGTPANLKNQIGDDVVRIAIGTAGGSGGQELNEKALSLVGSQSYFTGKFVD